MFDWQSFLDRNGIEYTDKGRNVSKGNLAIKCPFCVDDPSQHMNVSLKGYGYSCWRNAEHRSKNNAKLVRELLKCDWATAKQLVHGEDTTQPSVNDFEAQIRRLGEEYPRGMSKGLKLPSDWQPLTVPGSYHRSMVLEYLCRRGYSTTTALRQAKRYDIHYGRKDHWDRRVIWPIRNEHGHVVNYTGRAISDTQKVRYKTLQGDMAIARMSECLFDLPAMFRAKGEALLVVEGPFDAMRMGYLGEPMGIYTTCIFTQNVSETQHALLQRLSHRFERKFILFDKGAGIQSFRAAMDLDFETVQLPEGVKDPDTLSAGQALALCRRLLS